MKRRAKILLFLFLILLLLEGFFGFRENVSAATTDVIINEILIDGVSGEEFIELYNMGTNAIYLDNWYWTYYSSSRNWNNPYRKKQFPSGVKIESLSFYTIITKTGDFLTTENQWNLGYSSYQFSNSSGSIAIFPTNTFIEENCIDFISWGVVDYVGHGSEFTPPPVKKSWERIAPEKDSWQESYTDNGTPGMKNFTGDDEEPPPPPPVVYSNKIKINEIFPNPIESSEKKNEFVEIFNSGDTDIDLTGWYLSGKSGTFELSGIIEAGKYKAFFDTITLYNEKSTIKLFNPADEQADEITYPDPTAELENFSYSFDSTDWFWTSISTADAENQFDPVEDTSADDAVADDPIIDSPTEDTAIDYNVYLSEILPNPKGDEKLEEFIEIYNAENLEINLAGWTLKDSSKTKYIFPADTKIAAKKYLALYRPDFKFAMNNSGAETIYLLNKADEIISSVSYDGAKEDVSYNFDATDWHWSGFLTPGEENEFEKKLKVTIVKIKANPKGKDTEGEEIYLKNKSKEKVNLNGWSIATGSKILYNHPITKDFTIQPGKTKKITRKYSLFTLNNKKGAIELRYPNGEVASRVKYDKKKESVKDDEVYELSGKKWQWNAPPEEAPALENNLPENPLAPEENSEDTNQDIELNISDEEISINLGKYSAENKLALTEMKFLPTPKNILQSRETSGIVLGAFSARGENHKPIEIKSVARWQKTLQKSNQLFNLLINRIISLI